MGVIVGLLCALSWALGSILCKDLSKKLDPVTLNAPRALVGGVAMLILTLVTGRTATYSQVTTTKFLFLIGSVLLGGGIGDSLYVASMPRIGVSKAFPIASIYPAITFALGLAFLHESVTFAIAGGLVLVLVGVMLLGRPSSSAVARPSAQGDRAGIAMAMLAAVFWAVSGIIVAPGMEGLDPIAVASFRTPVLAFVLISIVIARGTWRQLIKLSKKEWLIIIVGGFVGWGLGSVLFLLSINMLGATRTAILTSTGPLFALPMSVGFLGEKVNRNTIAGTALTVAGVILVA